MKNVTTKSTGTVRLRTSLFAVMGVLAFLLASCTPPPTTFNFGPVTVPLPPIGAQADSVDYVIDIPGVPEIELTPYIAPVELTPYIAPIELTPYIPPVQLTPYIPEVCLPFVGCTPAVPATYSPAVPATYTPEVPATYSPAIPATYSPAISGGSCNAGYTPPAFMINDVTATVPLVSIDLAASTVNIPGVIVNIPAVDLIVGSAEVGCSIAGLPAVTLPTGDVGISFPARAVVQDATLDLTTGVLTLTNPSFTVNDATLNFAGLSADFSLPDITVPLPTITVPLV